MLEKSVPERVCSTRRSRARRKPMVTEMPKRSGVDQKPARAELERQLDSALQQTFPASDPVTIGEPTGHIPDRHADRQAPLVDTELVNELASHVKEKIAHGAKAASAQEAPPEQVEPHKVRPVARREPG